MLIARDLGRGRTAALLPPLLPAASRRPALPASAASDSCRTTPPPLPASQFVEKHCLAWSGGGGGDAARFAVNAAVVREYLAALVHTGRLSQFGDDASAAPADGQSHRSLAQLLRELQAVAAGTTPTAEPGASVMRPLHVIVQAQVGGAGRACGSEASRPTAVDVLRSRRCRCARFCPRQPPLPACIVKFPAQREAGGVWSALSSFAWTLLGVFSFFYIMSAGQVRVVGGRVGAAVGGRGMGKGDRGGCGVAWYRAWAGTSARARPRPMSHHFGNFLRLQAAFRRFQGGAGGMQAGLPGTSAGVAASSSASGGMFAAKEYNKVGGWVGGWVVGAPGESSQHSKASPPRRSLPLASREQRQRAGRRSGCLLTAPRPAPPACLPQENLPEKSVKKFKDVKGCDEAIAELEVGSGFGGLAPGAGVGRVLPFVVILLRHCPASRVSVNRPQTRCVAFVCVQEIVEYLKTPDKFTRLGGKLPKGVLLTGAPGERPGLPSCGAGPAHVMRGWPCTCVCLCGTKVPWRADHAGSVTQMLKRIAVGERALQCVRVRWLTSPTRCRSTPRLTQAPARRCWRALWRARRACLSSTSEAQPLVVGLCWVALQERWRGQGAQG